MTRRDALAAVLDHIVDADPLAAVEYCARARAEDAHAGNEPDAYFFVLESFALFIAARFDDAADAATTALDRCAEGDAVLLETARAARALAQSGRPFPGGLAAGWAATALECSATGDPLLDALAALGDAPEIASSPEHAVDGELQHFAHYLVAEAAIASARLHLAEAIIERTGPLKGPFLERNGSEHPFGLVLAVVRVRVLAFRGRISESIDLLTHLPPASTALTRQLAACVEILVRGNAAEHAHVRALADTLDSVSPVPHDYLTRGCFLLGAFGLVAIGDVRRAARFALTAGGDAVLSQLTTVDRALCLELLVAAAADEGDADAAEAWASLARPLRDDPIAASTARRIEARCALLAGDASLAREWAESAVELARGEGRAVEAAEAEVLAARARRDAPALDSGARRLVALAVEAESTGHVAARRAAVRELRASGRRVPPVAGVGWSGLSPRERDVALMVAEGLSNVQIADALHVSEHTVRAHVSRVLAAFGAASRFVVAARVAELFPDEGPPPIGALTPQQTAVARLVAIGSGNAEIGRVLGLSTKTVEKYIAEIQRRWQAPSRVAIARLSRRIPPMAE